MHFSPRQAYEKEDFVTPKNLQNCCIFSVFDLSTFFFFQVPAGLSEKEMCGNCEMIWQGQPVSVWTFLSYRNLIQENVVKLIGHKDQEEFFLFIGWAVHLEAWGWVGTFRISALATNVLFIPSALSDLWGPWTRMLSVCLCPWGNIGHWLIHLFPIFTPIQNLPQ